MVTKEALHLHKELISLCSELRAAFLMCWGSALSRSAGAWSSRSNKHISTNSIAWISFTSILWRVPVLLKGGGLADTAGAGVFFPCQDAQGGTCWDCCRGMCRVGLILVG